MRGRNYTAGERAVSILGVLSGKSLMEINEQLRQDAERNGGTLRPLPESSFTILKKAYALELAMARPDERERWDLVWRHITNPQPFGSVSGVP